MANSLLQALFVLLCSEFLRNVANGSSEESPLGEGEITKLVDAHNRYRRLVSPPASNMRLMTWNKKLAVFAQKKAEKCLYKHGAKEYSAVYGPLGENLYGTKGRLPNSKYGVDQAVFLWYEEYKDFSYERNHCQTGKVCHHYTQLVWAESTMVGCGIKYCPGVVHVPGRDLTGVTLLFCEYAPAGNTQQGFLFNRGVALPYKTGSPCSACSSGAQVCVKNLCLTPEEAAITTTTLSSTTTAAPTTTTLIPTTTNTMTLRPPTTTVSSTTTLATKPSTATTLTMTSKTTPTTTVTKQTQSYSPSTTTTKTSVSSSTPTKKTTRIPTTTGRTTARTTATTTTTVTPKLYCFACKSTSIQGCRDTSKKVLCDNVNDHCIAVIRPHKIELGCTSKRSCKKRKNLLMLSAKVSCCNSNYCNDKHGRRLGSQGFAVELRANFFFTLFVALGLVYVSL